MEEAERVLKIANAKKKGIERWNAVQDKIIDLGKREKQQKSIRILFTEMDCKGIIMLVVVIIIIFAIIRVWARVSNYSPNALNSIRKSAKNRNGRNNLYHTNKTNNCCITTTFKLSSPLLISSETAESVLSPTPTLLCCLEMEISILVVERTVVLEMPIKVVSAEF